MNDQTTAPTAPTLSDIIADMLAYQAEQFDGTDETDLNVSGADLVDAFTQWRIQLKAAAPQATANSRAIGLLRALTIDISSDYGHDTADELSGLDVVKNAASRLLDEMGFEPVSRDLIPNPDEEPISDVYEAAIKIALADVLSPPSAFTPPPIGLLEIADDLAGAVSSLQHQLNQVGQLYRYTDDEIVAAHDDGDEAVKRLDLYRKAVEAGPVRITVNLSGGVVQDVSASREVSGLEVVTIDYDVEGETDPDAVKMVRMKAHPVEAWEMASVTVYDANTLSNYAETPSEMRDATAEDMA